MACECGFVAGAGVGSMPFGSGPFGSGMAEDGLVLSGEARLLTANVAAVPFTGDPGFPNPGRTTSPLNPSNWVLVPIDAGATVRLVQFVQVVDEDNAVQFTDDLPQLALVTLPVFLVAFDGPLDPDLLYHLELHAPDVELTGCGCAELRGLPLRRDAIPTDERDGGGLLDIANPFVTRDALVVPPVLGTYQLNDRGDFGLDKSETASLRKRIERRVATAAGGFFHLPGYGAAPALKGVFSADVAERIRARVRAQVLQEPDVSEVTVSVSAVIGAPGMARVAVRAVPLFGDPVDVVAPISLP
jgi:hypothetical protein